MKYIFFLSILILFLSIVSCQNKTLKEETMAVQDQTPEVLDNSKTNISSVSKRYSPDIIQELYDEAVGKDPELKKLTEKISNIEDLKNDSLKQYWNYIENNDRYWRSATNYINQLSDSVLKKEIRAVFNNLETDYRNYISNHNNTIKELDKKELALKDCAVLMKLSVTLPMIKNYQNNELPEIERLNKVINTYDTLINQTKSYIRITKPLSK